MARRSKKHHGPKQGKFAPANAQPAHDAQTENSAPTLRPSPPISRRKLWVFRLTAAIGVPLLLIALLESGLRIAGFGYPTSFLISSDEYTRPVWIENPQFGWRFFGPKLSQSPASFAIPVEKPSDTIRVFVFGGSAALGDPQPDYGLSRMLRVMLSMRRGDLKFEVVNAGMIAINSHTVREIADDCTSADGDIWVIYMGNNEVVGPFGAGTIFGPQTPPMSLVRANLRLKATCTGQLLDRGLRSLRGSAQSPRNWGGMEMFLENKVSRDDPQMERVYHHFTQNLEKIIEAGCRNHVGVVVCTAAVNLKDCAPFASDYSRELTSDERAAWEDLYKQGISAQVAGDPAEAIGHFEEAASIDDQVADLQFRWGRSLLQLGEAVSARHHLELARDLDLLRFRCDGRMQSIVREVAGGRESESVRLVDAAEEFHVMSSPAVSGSQFFYDHVHLSFQGNYLLARLVAEQVEELLPRRSQGTTMSDASWPTTGQCADSLAWNDISHREVLVSMLARLQDPPFTAQLDHAEHLRRLVKDLAQLEGADRPEVIRSAAEQCQRAIDVFPEDHVLYSQLALLLGRAGDLESSYRAALKASQLLPHESQKWSQLGIVLAELGRDDEAAEAFRNACARDPNDVWARHKLAKTLIRLNRNDEALDELQCAVETNPSFGPAYLTIGLILNERGQAEAAERNFRKAVEKPVRQLVELAMLAQFCYSKGWYQDAVVNYLEALSMNPVDPALHIGAALSLAATEEFSDAEGHFREALQLAPNSADARYAYGVYLAKREQHADAAEQFAAAAELRPDFLDARINCGMALIASNRLPEALSQFEDVLIRDPKNPTAIEYKTAIESELQLKAQP